MNYIIHYSALNGSSQVLKQGKMKVKNKISKTHAKTSLEDYFKRKIPNFNRLIVYKCEELTELNEFVKKVFKTNLNLN